MAVSDSAARPLLVADIGGTNVRFALADGAGAVSDVGKLRCDDFPDLTAAAEAYLADVSPARRPRRGAFAIASPVTSDVIHMTNHPWSFSIAETGRHLGFDSLRVINDFMAIALGLPYLADDDLLAVGGGRAAAGTPVAVIGPGTGLGVSGLVFDEATPVPTAAVPLATEGGHVTMAASTDRESAVLALLREAHGHVSAERVISGPGLVNLYQSLCRLDGRAVDPAITPHDVTGRAVERQCPVCVEAFDMFCAMLGTVASNLCLSLGARGGIYIAGGIVPRFGAAFATSPFRARFENKGRFTDYLTEVPTFVITRDLPAFAGLARLG